VHRSLNQEETISVYLSKQKRYNTVMLITVIHVSPVLYEFSLLVSDIDKFFEDGNNRYISKRTEEKVYVRYERMIL